MQMEFKNCVLSPDFLIKNEKEFKINGKYHRRNPLNVGDSLLEAQIGQLEKTKRNPMGIGVTRHLWVLLHPLMPTKRS
jgi:hypothetical protein